MGIFDYTIRIWEEPFLNDNNLKSIKSLYDITFFIMYVRIIDVIKRADGVRLIAYLLSQSETIICDDKSYIFLSDKHYIRFLLSLTSKYGIFDNHNKFIPLNEFELLYEYFFKMEYSMRMDFFDMSKNGFNQQRMSVNGKKIIECFTNEHHAIYSMYVMRETIHRRVNNPRANQYEHFDYWRKAYSQYNTALIKEYGYNIRELIEIINKIIPLGYNKIHGNSQLFNNDVLLGDILINQEEITKIDYKNSFLNKLAIESNNIKENINSTYYYRRPIIKIEQLYAISLLSLIESVPEIIHDYLTIDTKKYVGNAFEIEVMELLDFENIAYKKNMHKELERKCQIDILIETKNKVYLIECKHTTPTIWHFYPPMMIKRAKSEHKEYERSINKKVKILQEGYGTKEIIPIIITSYPAYLAHYEKYLCITKHEFRYWIDNYLKANKQIEGINNFFDEYILQKTRELSIDFQSEPPLDIVNTNLRDIINSDKLD
ncbi:MAG: hypothetical protein WC916_07370 [Candidatus Woesearchaeota archaeon]